MGMTMKRCLALATGITAVVLGSAGPPSAQARDAASLALESAIHRQLVEGNLKLAITRYEAILAQYGTHRHVAAQALWRLARCQDQLGLPEARTSYERLLREHADNPPLVKAAQQRLTALMENQEWIERDSSEGIARGGEEDRPAETAVAGPANRPFLIVSDLTVHDPRTGQSRRLTDAVRSTAYPVLSPNALDVAYLSWNGDLRSTSTRGFAELRAVGIDGKGDRLIARNARSRWLRPFAWSPDGKQILTMFERDNGRRELSLVNVDDGSVKVLKTSPWLSTYDITFSGDGRFVAYQVSSPVRSRLDFFVLPAESGSTRERHYSVTRGGQRGGHVGNTDLAIHVLNRLGFGPRAGDIERVTAMGVDAYIDEQLHPERIADPVVDAKIAGFSGLEMDIEQLLEKAGPMARVAGRRRATIFERPAMAAETARMHAGGNGAASVSPDPTTARPADRPLDAEIHTARMIRAVHSTRQLQEVMVDFWMNHFNVKLDDHQLAPHFEQRAIRPYVFGRFEDMVLAVAKHPSMLYYLDNWRSSAPAEVVRQRIDAAKTAGDVDARLALLQRMPFYDGNKGLNENFARELLELHTMGVDSGYTQQDIIAVAKILTGWTIRSHGLINGREEDGVFGFDPIMHVDGDKTVLGRTFKGGGVEEGEQLIRMVARHPATARFIATKLARRFIADDPPRAVVEEASQTFLRTGGDIRATVRTILMSPQFRSSETIQAKIKKPFELVASALRAVDATFEDLDAYVALVAGPRSPISRMGEKMYSYEAPDGNPDVGPAWMNSNALLVRLDFANRLATNQLRGITSNLTAAQRLLSQLGLPKPTPLQIDQTRAMMQSAQADAAAAMGGQNMMTMGAGPSSAGAGPRIETSAIVVAAMLGSPPFQKR